MKAQASSRTILFALTAVIGTIILIFGAKIIDSVKEKGDEAEINKFVLSLRNVLGEVDSYGVGTVKEFSYILPGKIRKICFNDGSKTNRLVDQEFNSMSTYSDGNLYLFPDHVFKLNRLSLEENPLCFNIVKGVNLYLVKKDGGIGINVSNKKIDCTNIIYTGDENEKLDVVFLADNYNSLEKFREDVNKYIKDAFYAVKPFESNKGKLNFYLVNEFKDLGCEDINNNIICDSSKVKELAIRCPNDAIIILSKQGILSSLRSVVYDEIITVNTADNKYVVMHEMGHLIGDLADEYIVQGVTEVDAPNCDLKPIQKWDSNRGSFKECSSLNYYRPTKDSLMRAFGIGRDNTFGFFNEDILSNKLGEYK